MSENYVVLDEIVERQQTWPIMAAKYGVENPLPPWKTSLDGLCDVLDKSCAADAESQFTFKERRDEEDQLSASRYADLPFPENQLVSLAHSLLARGVISEDDLRQRLTAIRNRLQAGQSEVDPPGRPVWA
ncbi:MAG: thiocyanate hydrolase [Mycobacterium sp.]|nr:thiocyanate hydrolase [Mycobacterium sp.]